MYLFCNSRIHIITLYSGHVCVYYVSMLRCWHLVWILVWTDHPCLGVGCHSCYLSLLSLCMLCILSTLILNHGVLICWFLFMQSLICIRANQYWVCSYFSVCSCLVIICLNASSLISECCLIYLIFHNCNWTSINGMLLNRNYVLCLLWILVAYCWHWTFSPSLHEHIRVYLKHGPRPLFQKLVVGPTRLAFRPSVNSDWWSDRARWQSDHQRLCGARTHAYRLGSHLQEEPHQEQLT
jgi:hypothetical protein